MCKVRLRPNRNTSLVLISSLSGLCVISFLDYQSTFGLRNFYEQYATLILALASILLSLCGVYFRLKRSQFLLSFVGKTGMSLHTKALSISTLINFFVPFKVGEIVRSLIISRTSQISFGFSIFVIAIERSLDFIFITLILFIYFSANNFSGIRLFSTNDVFLLVAGSSVFLFVFFLLIRSRLLLKFVWETSGILNDSYAKKIRNSVWNVIVVFQQIHRKQGSIRKYLLYFALQWSLLMISFVLFLYTLGFNRFSVNGLVNLIPLVSFEITNADLSFSQSSDRIDGLWNFFKMSQATHSIESSKLAFDLFSMPLLIFGILALTIFSIQKVRTPNNEIMTLPRKTRIEENQSVFLESFFLKDRIVEEIHTRSVLENFRILRFFKGGSQAVTILIERDSRITVRKLVGGAAINKLISQQEWLDSVNSDQIVKCLAGSYIDDLYQLELEYIGDSIPLFDLIHQVPLDDSKKTIECVWKVLMNNIYTSNRNSDIETRLAEYIDENFYERLSVISNISDNLNTVLKSQLPLYINGSPMMGLLQVMQAILSNKSCMRVLNEMTLTDLCHGDLTVDNILVIPKLENRPIIIDPSDDNNIKGPLIDASRMMQSLRGGYEFLNLDDDPVDFYIHDHELHLSFKQLKSSIYQDLDDWLTSTILPNLLTTNEIQALNFHVGLFYTRMLSHRFRTNPNNILKYYGTSVEFLNNFYNEVSAL
jgi:hypothetical protein